MDTLIEFSVERPTPSIFWFGHTLSFVITNPEDMKTILTSQNCLQKPYIYKFMGGKSLGLFNSECNLRLWNLSNWCYIWFVNLIFISKAHLWKKDRKAINMTFNNKILHSFVPIFNDKTAKLCEALAKKSNEAFDISSNIFATTLEMVCCK